MPKKEKNLTPVKNFDQLPDSANIRLPAVQILFACSGPTVWRHVKLGFIPSPKKRGGITYWNVGEIRQALQGSRGTNYDA